MELLNDVVLNQVLFRFATDDETDDVLRRVQDAGDVWMSGTTWDGRRAIRVSVSNWQTTEDEIVKAVSELLSDPLKRRELAQRARAWASANLTWDRPVADFERLYASVSRKHPA